MNYSYSQFCEDRAILNLFPPGYVGSYLDIGANHPVETSNTYLLYLHGWRGVTVEPVPAMRRLHREQRPGDIQLPYAVTDQDGEAEFFIPDHTPVATLDAVRASAMMASGHPTRILRVPTRTMWSALDEMTHDAFLYHYLGIWKAPAWFGTVPDVLSVDVEGCEKQVFESTPFASGWLPGVIIVEACLPCTETPCHKEWEHILVGFGYVYDSTYGVNRLYTRRGMPVLKRQRFDEEAEFDGRQGTPGVSTPGTGQRCDPSPVP